MLCDAVLELVGVAGQVDVVETKDAEEVVDAVSVAIGDLGFDGVANLIAEDAAPALGDKERALEGRRAYVDDQVKVGAVQALVALDGCGVVAVGGFPRTSVGGLAHGGACQHVPAVKAQGKRDLRAQVEAPGKARGREVRFYSFEACDGGGGAPEQGRAGDGVVHAGEVD